MQEKYFFSVCPFLKISFAWPQILGSYSHSFLSFVALVTEGRMPPSRKLQAPPLSAVTTESVLLSHYHSTLISFGNQYSNSMCVCSHVHFLTPLTST